MEAHELKNCEKLFQNIVIFLHVVLSKHCKYQCFGWFALRTGSKEMKKTLVFAVHLKPLVEKHRKTQCFLQRSLKNSVNSDVLDDFRLDTPKSM